MRGEKMADILETKVYQDIKETLEFARNKAYVAINYALVGAYWNIGKIIIKAQDGNEKADVLY